MKIYAIRYAEHFKYATKGSVFRNTPDAAERIEDFAFFYYLAEVDDKYYLVDTGFRDEELAEKMGVHIFPMGEVEQVFGKMPQIDTVIITHSHWDHINNLDLYPEASVVMAKKAYEIARETGTDAVKERLMGGNLTLVEDECWIADKFLFQLIGGHTPDSSVVFFEEAGKKYVITGDECYQRENVIRNIPIGLTSDAEKNEKFIASIHEQDIIPLPFHDASILEKYTRLSENIVQII